MKKCLIDTHILIWALFSDGSLSKKAYKILNDENSEIYYSAASIWEIAIKHAKHPDQMPLNSGEVLRFCKTSGFRPLPITEDHAAETVSLRQKKQAVNHNDPFDRILIAQAKIEGLTFLTHDSRIKYYDEPCVMHV